MKRFPAGRLGDSPSVGLSSSLSVAGFKLGRLQTGTPARLDRRTIDFSHLPAQQGDALPSPFSFSHDVVDNAVLLFCVEIRNVIRWFQSRKIKLHVIRLIRQKKRIRSSETTCI